MGRTHGGRWWIPGYGVVVDPDIARVATYSIAIGFLGCTLPAVTLFFGHPGIAVHWTAVWIIGGILLIESMVAARDLRGLLGSDFKPAPVLQTLAQILAAVVAVGLADYAGGGTHGYYYFLVLLPVGIAAVVGNVAFLAVVWLAGMGMLVGTALAGGVPHGSLATLLVTAGVATGTVAAMVHILRRTMLRLYHGFLRMADITAVILRAGGFDEALSRFLPLVAVQAEARRVDAYRRDGTTQALIGSWPFGSPPPAMGIPDGAVSLSHGPGRTVSGFTIGSDRTTIFSVASNDDTIVLIVHRRAPAFWSRTAYRFAMTRVAAELGLLVQHRDYLLRLDELSQTDSLTSLANRRTLTRRLDDELAAARRRGTPFALAMIDLDFFKEYNDTYGHLLGDEALVVLSRLLRDHSRATDLVARYGGEEFCVVLPDTDRDGALRWIEEIRVAVRDLPTRRPITCSVGIASSVGHEGVDSILRAADTALYQAKAAGRDRVHLAEAPTAAPGWGFRPNADPTVARL